MPLSCSIKYFANKFLSKYIENINGGKFLGLSNSIKSILSFKNFFTRNFQNLVFISFA